MRCALRRHLIVWFQGQPRKKCSALGLNIPDPVRPGVGRGGRRLRLHRNLDVLVLGNGTARGEAAPGVGTELLRGNVDIK